VYPHFVADLTIQPAQPGQVGTETDPRLGFLEVEVSCFRVALGFPPSGSPSGTGVEEGKVRGGTESDAEGAAAPCGIESDAEGLVASRGIESEATGGASFELLESVTAS